MNPEIRDQDAADAALAASVLEGASLIDRWSRCCLMAIALLVSASLVARVPPAPLVLVAIALSILAGAAQAYWAWRASLDARIFADLRERWRYTASTAQDLQRLDEALPHWFPATHPPVAQRPLAERISGARRLFVRQTQCLGVQFVSLVSAMLILSQTTLS